MKVKVVDMFRQTKEQQVVINNLEREWKELQEFLSACEKSYVRDSPSADDDDHLQKSYVDDKDVPDEQGIPKSKTNPKSKMYPNNQTYSNNKTYPKSKTYPKTKMREKEKVTYSLESNIEEGNV